MTWDEIGPGTINLCLRGGVDSISGPFFKNIYILLDLMGQFVKQL